MKHLAPSRSGFNLIEVVASLMIVSSSLAIGVALMTAGLRISGDSRSVTLGAATALSVAYDDDLLHGARETTHGSSPNAYLVKSGEVNGYFVQRWRPANPPRYGRFTVQDLTVKVYEASYEADEDSVVIHQVTRMRNVKP